MAPRMFSFVMADPSKSAVKSLADPIKSAIESLVSARSVDGSVFVSVPLIFPSGTVVTVRIDPAPGGFRVSDNGFAYREIEAIGAERSFAKTVDKIVKAEDITRNKRVIYVDVPNEQIERAIFDVSAASWRVVDRIYSFLNEEDVTEMIEHLQGRLETLFGAQNVENQPTLVGASTISWPVTATVKHEPKITVFHVVSNHSSSVFRASAAFRDLSLLDHPPSLIAVVRNKPELGPKQSLLTQARGKVIQEDQPDDVYRRVAA
jgi:hypothetical protein